MQDIMRAVKWHVAHYFEIKKAVANERAERKRHAKANIGGIQDSKQSDPTAAAAIANLTPIGRVTLPGEGTVIKPELWISAIETGLHACPEDVQEVVQQNMWHHHSWRYVTSMSAMDKKTFYRRRDMALTAVAIAAAQYGLVRIKEED